MGILDRDSAQRTQRKKNAIFQNVRRNSSTFLYSDMWTNTTINKCHQDMYGIKIRGTFCRSCLQTSNHRRVVRGFNKMQKDDIKHVLLLYSCKFLRETG